MALAQLLRAFQVKAVSYKQITPSQQGKLQKGDNYIFAISDDVAIPKSRGFLSSTGTELVLTFTSDSLNLIADDKQEDCVYEVLATINRDLKISAFLFTSRGNKFQFQCRARIQEKQDLPIISLWTYLGRIEQEYKESGKRLHTMLRNQSLNVDPGLVRMFNPQKPALERFLTTSKHYKGQITDSTQNCTTISLTLTVWSTYHSAKCQVPARVKVYQDYITCIMSQTGLVQVQSEALSQMIALSNHLEVEPIGCLLTYTTRNSECTIGYKADFLFAFIDETELIRRVVPKFLYRCGKKYVHRQRMLVRNSIPNSALEIREALSRSEESLNSTDEGKVDEFASDDPDLLH